MASRSLQAEAGRAPRRCCRERHRKGAHLRKAACGEGQCGLDAQVPTVGVRFQGSGGCGAQTLTIWGEGHGSGVPRKGRRPAGWRTRIRGPEWGWGSSDPDHTGKGRESGVRNGIRTCVGEAKVKDICPGPAAGAGAAAASA